MERENFDKIPNLLPLRQIEEKFNATLQQKDRDKSPFTSFRQGYFTALQEVQDIINEEGLSPMESYNKLCDYILRQRKYNNIKPDFRFFKEK